MHEKKEVQYSACDYCTSFLSSYLVDTGLAGYRLYQPFFLKDPHQQHRNRGDCQGRHDGPVIDRL